MGDAITALSTLKVLFTPWQRSVLRVSVSALAVVMLVHYISTQHPPDCCGA